MVASSVPTYRTPVPEYRCRPDGQFASALRGQWIGGDDSHFGTGVNP